MKFYFISTKELTNTEEITNEQWIEIAKSNGENYCLTEEQFNEHWNDEYLEEMEYRKI